MSDVLPAGAPPAATEAVPAPQAKAPEAAPNPANPAEKLVEAATTETPVEAPKDGDKPEPLRDPVTGQFVVRSQRTEKLVSQIGQLTRTKHDLSREIGRLKEEAIALQKQLQEKPEIDPADFAAQQRYDIQTALKAERLNDKVEQLKHLQTEHDELRHEDIREQAESLRAQIPDIDSIFLPTGQGGPIITQVMFEAISRADNGALVAYHLKNNPREAARIAQADPWTVALEIGRIAAQVKPAPVRRVSQAPQPVQTVSGAPGNPAPDIASLSFRDYERLMNERDRARLT